MYNKKYVVVIKHFDYFVGTEYKQVSANNIKEVEAIKKDSTWFVDDDSYQEITAVIPQWVFEKPTHQSVARPQTDDLPWSSNIISNDTAAIRDINFESIFVDENEYAFDKGDVVF